MKRSLSKAAQTRIDKIITIVNEMDFEGVTASEGGSGLLKLAASVGHNNTSSVKFEEDDNNMLLLQLTYTLEQSALGLTIVS